MTTSRPKDILEKIDAEDASVRGSSELSALVNGQVPKLTNEERQELVRSLVNRNIFLWLEYVSSELRVLASLQDSYVELLAEVVNKVRLDMAQGPIIESLIGIGVNDPQLGIGLSSAMRKRSDEALAVYSAFPLGGAARTALNMVQPVLSELWQSEDASDRLIYLRAYRVIFEPNRAAKKEIPPSLLEQVEECIASSDLAVRQEAVHTLFDFSEINEERSIKSLTRVAKVDRSLRGLIVNRLRLQDRLSTDSVMALLEIIVEDEDDSVLSEVASLLAFRGAAFQKEAMQMILSMVARGKYHKVHLLDYAAQQVAKSNVSAAIKSVDDFLRRGEQEEFSYVAPYLLCDISKSDYVALTDYVSCWLRDEPRLQDIALRTARELLGHAFEGNDPTVAEKLHQDLTQYAKQRGVDVERTVRGEPDKTAQCIELVLATMTQAKSLDYGEIEKNLGEFPSLRNFLGNTWLNEKKAEGNRYHPLLFYLQDLSQESQLQRLEPQEAEVTSMEAFLKSLTRSNLLRPRAMLTYLDEATREVQPLRNLGNLKRRFRADDNFLSALSELQILYPLMKSGYRTIVEPCVGSKRLDLEATIDGSDILFEVIRPGVFRRLRYSSGAIMIPNRVRGKVRDEVADHLPELSTTNKKPIVIVIDISSSEIGYEEVVDCLYGTSQATFVTNRASGRPVFEGWTRARDSLHEERLDIISGILAYKAVVAVDGKVHFQGRLFPNPAAQNPLTSNQISAIENVMFGVQPTQK